MYILIEQAMNGTVTMNTYVYVFDFKNFDQAVTKIKQKLLINAKGLVVTYTEDSPTQFAYRIEGKFPVFGYIRNNKAKIYRENDETI